MSNSERRSRDGGGISFAVVVGENVPLHISSHFLFNDKKKNNNNVCTTGKVVCLKFSSLSRRFVVS